VGGAGRVKGSQDDGHGTSGKKTKVGGSNHNTVANDVREFQRLGSDILIGTPGRLEDFICRYGNVVQTNQLECLVLDEADRLLDVSGYSSFSNTKGGGGGFDEQVTNVLSKLPRMRRTGLFSATRPDLGNSGSVGGSAALKRLMKRAGMRNPVVVDVAVAVNAPSIPASAAESNSQTKSESEQSGNKCHKKEKDDSDYSDDSMDVEERNNDEEKEDRKDSPIATAQSSSLPEQSEQTKGTQQRSATPSTLTNHYIVSPLEERLPRLVAFLRHLRNVNTNISGSSKHGHGNQQPSNGNECIVVFFMTCASVEFYGMALKGLLLSRARKGDRSNGIVDKHPPYTVETLHGRQTPRRREMAMERFRASAASSSSIDGNDSNRGVSVLLCTDVAARGIDIPDVSWTIQYDPPVNPDVYVHRAGRAGRAGRPGKSLLMVTRHEESFVDMLRSARNVIIDEVGGGPHGPWCDPPVLKHLPPTVKENETATSLDEMDNDKEDIDTTSPTVSAVNNSTLNATTIPDVLPKLRKMVMSDRDLLEKGTKAFTSYVRAYKEHKCSFIFRFASLDLGLLATSFCLLRLPKMPELRDKLIGGKLKNFESAARSVDIHAIGFRDKVREDARQKRLELEKININSKGDVCESNDSQKRIVHSNKSKGKGVMTERKRRDRDPDVKKKRRGRQAIIYDEWEQLGKEERLYKKLRKGKITEAQYNHLMYGDSVAKVDDMCFEDLNGDEET